MTTSGDLITTDTVSYQQETIIFRPATHRFRKTGWVPLTIRRPEPGYLLRLLLRYLSLYCAHSERRWVIAPGTMKLEIAPPLGHLAEGAWSAEVQWFQGRPVIPGAGALFMTARVYKCSRDGEPIPIEHRDILAKTRTKYPVFTLVARRMLTPWT